MRSTCWLAVAALTAGCTLFTGGDPDAAGPADAFPRPDANEPRIDAGVPDAGFVCTDCGAGAGTDFDGDAIGQSGRWRYVEDRRDFTWRPMDVVGAGLVGANPANRIASCAGSTAPACAWVPGGLLMSSAGGAGPDAALEYTFAGDVPVLVTLRAYIPAGQAAQTFRVYRNQHLDYLDQQVVTPGVPFELLVEVDPVPGDRLIIVPISTGPAIVDMALDVTLADPYPANPPITDLCTTALVPPTAPGATTVENRCGLPYQVSGGPLDVVPGPIPGLDAIAVRPGTSLSAQVPLNIGYQTVQFWLRTRSANPDLPGFVYSNVDPTTSGGMGIAVFQRPTGPVLSIVGRADLSPALTMPWRHGEWHFVRVTQFWAMSLPILVCVDGVRQADPSPLSDWSRVAPTIGRNGDGIPVGAHLDADLADFRINEASYTPCF
jgi:hypothetical protein